MKTLFALLLVICSIVGIFDAGYITYTKFSGQVPQCRPPFACETVLKSPWSTVGPIPLSVFGLIFYGVMSSLSTLAVGEVQRLTVGNHTFFLPLLISVWGVLGAGFSLYLVFVMAIILHAWCLYCLISAINCMMIGIFSTMYFWLLRPKQDTRKAHYAMHV